MKYTINPLVEQAIEDLYFQHDKTVAHKAFEQLKTIENDGDAYYLLARCYAGDCYIYSYFDFPEDDELVEEYMEKSILCGSPMGVIGSMRCGLLTDERKEKMPFSSLKEAWDILYTYAQAGNAFCQNMIANTYYWLDIVEINEMKESDYTDPSEFGSALIKYQIDSIDWYLEAFHNGMSFAGRNIVTIFETGLDGILEPKPEKAMEIKLLGASYKYPEWMHKAAFELEKQQKTIQEAMSLYEEAGKLGFRPSLFNLGLIYFLGNMVKKDYQKALSYFEKGIGYSGDSEDIYYTGLIYFQGDDNIKQDYKKAFEYIKKACDQKFKKAYSLLAIFYLDGLACNIDEQKAIALMKEATDDTYYHDLAEGILYDRGVYYEQDYKKAAECFIECNHLPYAQKKLAQFRKTWYGKWVKR